MSSNTLGVASLMWGAAAIHALVAPDHLREWGPSGAVFVAAAAFQLAWGAVIFRRPTRRRLLVAAYGNAALVLVWLVSRTVGVPVGPDAGQPEALGALDALASLNEVIAVALIALLLAGRTVPTRFAQGSAGALAAASLVAVLTVSPHAHDASHHSHAAPGHAHDTPTHAPH